MRDKKPELLLVLDPKVEHEHYSTPRWTLDLPADLLELEDGQPRGLVTHPEWDHLQIRALASDDMGEGERSYGWGVEFRGYQILDLRDVEAKVRTLRKVQRALDKIRYPDWPSTFGAYLLVVAKVLGVKHFGYWTDRRPNGTRQLVLLDGPEAAAAHADGLVAKFFAEHPAKPKEAN